MRTEKKVQDKYITIIGNVVNLERTKDCTNKMRGKYKSSTSADAILKLALL